MTARDLLSGVITFKDLIAPLDAETFFNDYFEKEYRIARGAVKNKINCIITSKEIFETIQTLNLGYPKVALAKDGGRISLSEYNISLDLAKESQNITLNPKLFQEYKTGASLILQNLQTWHKKTSHFCSGLSNELNFRFNVNSYLSPISSAGFPRHFDSHDAFIIQLEGKKTWQLFKPQVHLPNKDIPYTNFDLENAEHIETIVLEAGDVMYMPRGLVHEVHADEKQSLHLTVGIHPWTILDVLKYLSTNKECHELRQTISTRLDGSDFEENFAGIIKKLSEKKYQGKIKDAFPLMKFEAIEDIPTFPELYDTESNVLKYNYGIPCRYHEIHGAFYVFAGNNAVALTDEQKTLFFELKDKGQINIDELPDNKEQTDFLNKLKLAGLLF